MNLFTSLLARAVHFEMTYKQRQPYTDSFVHAFLRDDMNYMKERDVSSYVVSVRVVRDLSTEN